MKNLAIIPARGGSKRIPRKNIRDFLGKPIIAYSIEIALKSGLFDEVMVSTDDKEIANIAKSLGASTPFLRSKENADDFSTLSDVVDEIISNYKEKGIHFDNICCILPTSPLLSIENLSSAYEKLLAGEFDSIKPIVKFSYPIQRALRFTDGKVEMMHPEHLRTRSQDIEPAYHDAGQFYWLKPNLGLKTTNKGAIVISEKTVQDIDTPEDWEMAEFKYKLINKTQFD